MALPLVSEGRDTWDGAAVMPLGVPAPSATAPAGGDSTVAEPVASSDGTGAQTVRPLEQQEEQLLVLHFEDDNGSDGLLLEPWVSEQFEYFSRLMGSGFSESQRGEAQLPCRRQAFETFLMLARGCWRPAAVDLTLRMEVLRFADMVSIPHIVKELAESIRQDYLAEGDGAKDCAVTVLCELADLLTPTEIETSEPIPPTGRTSSLHRTRGRSAAHAPPPPSPAAIWLVAAAGAAPMTSAQGLPAHPLGASAASTGHGGADCQSEPWVELREACLDALPPWTRQRLAERPQLWRLHLRDVLEVYGAEASPRAESSWLALHAARRLTKDILPFACVDNEVAQRLAKEHPEVVVQRCVTLWIRELPFSKAVSGFGGTEYEIQVALAPGTGGGWVLGVGGQGLCALRKVVLEVESFGLTVERHELEFTGLMEHASGRQEDAVLGFASGMQRTPLPFSAKLTILEYPLHLAVQTYVGLNFNTMAMLCQGFDFGPMDLACVMDLWLQSDQLRRVPEADIAEVVRRTLRFVRATWAPVVRVSFVVCMHSCWMQAGHVWWHASLIRSCVELEVWNAPNDGEPGAGTFRSYVAQIVQHALAPYPEMFVSALQGFVERLPPVELSDLEAFFQVPASLSDPIAVVARHYLDLLKQEASLSSKDSGTNMVTVETLGELLAGFQRLVGRPLERSDPKVAVLAFLALAALCDLRHQRRMCAESLSSLLLLESRATDGPEARFWAGCFFTLLEFSNTLRQTTTTMCSRADVFGFTVPVKGLPSTAAAPSEAAVMAASGIVGSGIVARNCASNVPSTSV
eukprot:TRINITY_DN41006_c0_g1_i1.p1 TRINITY_DN41006_c0_g1~~TRINITY_DN41006_c0_g1_i1.p1  ORF type:complete len:804 (-),score=135.09 TRINITY_DN41006_c0_g1_i1:9-2420(-)